MPISIKFQIILFFLYIKSQNSTPIENLKISISCVKSKNIECYRKSSPIFIKNRNIPILIENLKLIIFDKKWRNVDFCRNLSIFYFYRKHIFNFVQKSTNFILIRHRLILIFSFKINRFLFWTKINKV